jgi:hypothetical protein
MTVEHGVGNTGEYYSMETVPQRSDVAVLERSPLLSQFRSLSQRHGKRRVFCAGAQTFLVSSAMD